MQWIEGVHDLSPLLSRSFKAGQDRRGRVKEEVRKMEGKCRPRTVQQRAQSDVEGGDWCKEQHLLISYMDPNSRESHGCVALCRCAAAGREADFQQKARLYYEEEEAGREVVWILCCFLAFDRGFGVKEAVGLVPREAKLRRNFK